MKLITSRSKQYILLLIISIFSYNSYCQHTKLKVGDKIPDFELYNQYGRTFSSYNESEKNKPIVIFFYPKDESKLSTKQFKIVKKNIDLFKKHNAIIIGINPESVVSHKRFVIKNRLPFFLLFDRNNGVQKMFGIPNQGNSKKPKRYTIIINKNRVITNIFYNKKDVSHHVNQALIALNNLN